MMSMNLKRMVSLLAFLFFALLFTACPTSTESTPKATETPVTPETPEVPPVVTPPSDAVRLVFIHHSCGGNWLASGNGGLRDALNENNYYVSESDYGWDAEIINGKGDDLGTFTDTGNWPMWFNENKMPYVYASSYNSEANSDSMTAPDGENDIIMFKSCYPLSDVGDSIEDEQAIYDGLLTYFADHTDKLFVLITPPGETVVPSANLTRELCDWLVSDDGWLADYTGNNVLVYDFYCTLSETGSHHRLVNGVVEHVWDVSYDGTSPYHNNDNHPNATGNQKATAEFIPLLNAAWNRLTSSQ